MRYQILVPGFASLGVLAACADQPTSPTPGVHTSAPLSAVGTAATRTEFEGLIHPCGGTPTEETVTPGDVLHLLATNRNEWVTGNPLVDGVESNVARININLKTGKGVANIRSTITPDGVEGTWEMRYQVRVTGGFPGSARGVGHGTGELHGMTLKFTAQPPVPGENTCIPELGFVVPIRGVIIAPAVSG
jgi:hypothetical protein